MTLHVYTARHSAYAGDDALDIMRGTAEEYRARGSIAPGEPWAPPRWLLDIALGRASALPFTVPTPPKRTEAPVFFRWYADRYREVLDLSSRLYLPAWMWLEAQESVTLLCACVNPSACHRVVCAQYLAARGAVYEGER